MTDKTEQKHPDNPHELPDLSFLMAMKMAFDDLVLQEAVLKNPAILEYLILVRLNHKLQIPKFVVKMWLASRVLLQDKDGVYINPVIEDVIDEAIEVMTEYGTLEKVKRDAEHRAKRICRMMSW